MPVKRQYLYALGVFLPDMASEGKNQYREEHRQANDDVGRVQANKGIKSRPKKIGPDREPVIDR